MPSTAGLKPIVFGRRPWMGAVEVVGDRPAQTPERSVEVLLRHRLLREAEVGECTFAVPVEDDPRHPAVADVQQC